MLCITIISDLLFSISGDDGLWKKVNVLWTCSLCVRWRERKESAKWSEYHFTFFCSLSRLFFDIHSFLPMYACSRFTPFFELIPYLNINSYSHSSNPLQSLHITTTRRIYFGGFFLNIGSPEICCYQLSIHQLCVVWPIDISNNKNKVSLLH